MPKLIKNFRSRYLVVHDEKRRPHDNACNPVITMNRGKQRIEMERLAENVPVTT
jgi:hypothetical protein